MRSLHVLFLAFGITSCGESAPETPPIAPLPPEPPVVEPTPTWEVHEWGLIDVPLAGGGSELSAGPGRAATLEASRPPAAPPTPVPNPSRPPPSVPTPPSPVVSPIPPPPVPHRPPMPMRKPVLYVHLGDGRTEMRFDLDVHVPGGSVLEHWPAGAGSGDLLGWSDVTARACDALPTVPPFEGPCDAPDGYCERHDLGDYTASGAACLEVGGTSAPFLFYRGSSPLDALPLRYSEVTAGGIEVVYAGDVAPVRRVLRFAHVNGALLVSEAEIPAGGGTFVLPMPTTPADRAALEAGCRADLVALGLTESEADAFVRAWASELFAVPAAREAPAIVDSYLLYWAPTSAVDRMAELTFTPVPTRVVRAMAARVELP